MRRLASVARTAIVAALLALPPALVATPSHAVWVAPARVDSELRPISEGLAEWLRQRIRGAGLRVADGRAARELIRSHEGSPSVERWLAAAASEREKVVVLVDLGLRRGQVRLVFRVYDSASQELLAAGRGEGALESLHARSEEAVRQILASLGSTVSGASPVPHLQLGNLAAAGRALARLDRGEPTRAYRAVAGRFGPTATELRQRIVDAASKASVVERARLLVETGKSAEAWRLISRQAMGALDAKRPDPRLLLAAGEVQLERGDARKARAFLERAIAVDPRNADAHLALGGVLALQNDRAGARRALERAAQLDGDSPHGLEKLAEFERSDPARRARVLMRAAAVEAERISLHRTQTHLQAAIQLDRGLAASAHLEEAELKEKLGRPAEALESYSRAVEAGAPAGRSLRGLARAQRALGELGAAEASFEKALSLEPKHPDALHGLGEVYLERGRAKEALALLERATRLDPNNGEARRALGRALRARGENRRAFQLLEASEGWGLNTADDLGEAAQIRDELGDVEGAGRDLERAVDIDPGSPTLRERLADLLQRRGETEEATRQREIAQRLSGGGRAPAPLDVTQPEQPQAPLRSTGDLGTLVKGFLPEGKGAADLRMAVLGARGPRAWKQRARAWVHPLAPDRPRVDAELPGALAKHFDVFGAAAPGPDVEERLARLFHFESPGSRNVRNIAAVNQALGSDAVFLARLSRPSTAAGKAPSCPPGHVEIELRMLGSQVVEYVTILANSACLPGGLAAYETWNYTAYGIYLAFLLFVMYPVLRGWGSVVISVKLPPKTRAMFSARVSRRPAKISSGKVRKDEKAKSRFEKRLRSFARRERPLIHNQTVFRWVPVRRKPYYVIIRGPIHDFVTRELIGEFAEQQTLRVRRGRVEKIGFDFRPKECAVEVTLQYSGKDARQARVGLRGNPDSLRYVSNGRAFLYLKKGNYVVVGGAGDRVAEYPLQVESYEAKPLFVDLDYEPGLLFQGCPQAVAPYLEGDFETAANILEAAGLESAHRVRACWHKERGEIEEAGGELEAAGDLAEAAELRAASADHGRSAELFQEAGDFERAAEAYRENGDLPNAARAYEEAYDYENAIQCYRETGNLEGLVGVLEKTGEYFEAGRVAAETLQFDRAIDNLQQIGRRDDHYAEACQILAEILSERDETDLALAKCEEALEVIGEGEASLELQARYAALLERAERLEEALAVYERIRRRDVRFGQASERIEALRERLKQQSAPAAAPSAPVESRYEILEEAGRGGMGIVYKARDKHLGRIVALKHLPENLRDHPTAVKFFLREARSAAALNHPNVVTVYDAGQENDTYFITMEYMEGLPLSSILTRRGKLSPRDVARLGAQVASGLHYAHEKGIVHRDIKTSNLFFTREGVVKVMDFGLAKMVEEVRRASTMIAGTPYYMAPEQAAGDAVDHRADIYALGVTFFQLVTGTVPFDKGDVTHHHRHTPPPDPREREPSVPDAMAEMILEMMIKDPEQRLASAGEVASRLRAIFDGGSG